MLEADWETVSICCANRFGFNWASISLGLPSNFQNEMSLGNSKFHFSLSVTFLGKVLLFYSRALLSTSHEAKN